jgi:microcin C transport system ATP-binding protein
MSLLEVAGLEVAFGERRVVRGVSFTLEHGQTLALVGESGSGKSLTALSLLQLLPPGASNPAGRIMLNGNDILNADERRLRSVRGGQAGMIFQEPMTSLNPLQRIGKQVAEAVTLHQKLGRAEVRARVIALLTQAGFADAAARLDAFPHQLSGGQRQRVMIAMALANDPALLIADEPTTALDVTIQAQILTTLKAMQRARGLALLLISHDLTIVRQMADFVCVMREGEIVEAAAGSALFANPAHPYTRALLAAEPEGPPAPLPRERVALMEADRVRVGFPVRRGVMRRKTGEVVAVAGVSLTVHAGETVGLVGESGSGKTTLGFASLGLQACEGAVRFEGVDLSTLNAAQLLKRRARMQVVFQDPFGSLSPRMSVAEIVAEGLRVHRQALSRAARQALVAAALAEVGLPEAMMTRYPNEFSGGQRQRIAIARAMVLQPRYVVLDEPTSALDLSVQAQIVALLRTLQAKHGLGYLFISHDLRVIRAIAHRVVVMRKGEVVEEGEAAALFANPQQQYTRDLLAAAFGQALPSR